LSNAHPVKALSSTSTGLIPVDSPIPEGRDIAVLHSYSHRKITTTTNIQTNGTFRTCPQIVVFKRSNLFRNSEQSKS